MINLVCQTRKILTGKKSKIQLFAGVIHDNHEDLGNS
jgi:hypothetical protein